MQQIMSQLYQGNMEDTLNASCDSNIDIIIYLGQDIPTKLCFNCRPTCIHIPIVDGKNNPSKIKNVILISMAVLKNKKVLVSCRAGLSRSIVITTAIFALQNKVSFNKAYEYIKKILPQSQPELNLFRETEQIVNELI